MTKVHDVSQLSVSQLSRSYGIGEGLPDARQQGNLAPVSDEPIVAASALKHGLEVYDILHAYRNPIRAWDLGEGFTMVVGADAAANLLEVGYVQGATAVVVVHAMRARKSFLR
ncbi:hypothetical protein [Raineyella sp. W15-4]|uniref:hypothetical protein n=1 Tax=Raineyella sp. W15-4 TaxID=3081651 RepID=UPI0029553964|nr:hypothetical protein [Raineyella sp. W15-4]WOQ17566.1 hypothetical protein R0145_02305 [Raineyella sp. W15-4]